MPVKRTDSPFHYSRKIIFYEKLYCAIPCLGTTKLPLSACTKPLQWEEPTSQDEAETGSNSSRLQDEYNISLVERYIDDAVFCRWKKKHGQSCRILASGTL